MPSKSTKADIEWLLFRRWDSHATGVPRRFGMSIMFMMMTMYALLFAFMKMMDTPPWEFAIIAIFVTGVGFAQMALFGGRYPRAASIWSGAILFPVEIFFYTGAWAYSDTGQTLVSFAIGLFLAILSTPFGAFFGYLSGGLTAGAFLLIEMYNTKFHSPDTKTISDVKIVNEEESANKNQ